MAIKAKYNVYNKEKGAFEGPYHFETDSDQVIGLVEAIKTTMTGTLTDAERFSIVNAIIPGGAPQHNSLYRGKDLTDYFASGDMSKAIAAGTFDDIFVGDYIKKSITVSGTEYKDVVWRVGDCDYNYGRGSLNQTVHHVLMVPDTTLGNARMNSSNTTAGAYQGSEMWTTTIPKYVTGIESAFGSDHVLEHKEILHNNMNADAWSAIGNSWKGASYTDWSKTPWATVKVNLFNTMMTYGSGIGSSWTMDYSCNKQIALFRLGQNFLPNNWYWLRDVTTSTYFALAYSDGSASRLDASNAGGVRVYFLLR